MQWEGKVPYPKKIEDVLDHVLPFAVHEVRDERFLRSDTPCDRLTETTAGEEGLLETEIKRKVGSP